MCKIKSHEPTWDIMSNLGIICKFKSSEECDGLLAYKLKSSEEWAIDRWVVGVQIKKFRGMWCVKSKVISQHET